MLRIRVPEAFAAAYLRGYRVGPLLFVDPNHPSSNVERRAARAVAIASEAPITEALLRDTLRESTVGMGRDTYSRWRLPEVLHLYEHFVGSEVVARAAVDRLVELGAELEGWGFAGEDPYRTNTASHFLALALPWILMRVDPRLAVELRADFIHVRSIRHGRVHRDDIGPTSVRGRLRDIAAVCRGRRARARRDGGDKAERREPHESIRVHFHGRTRATLCGVAWKSSGHSHN